MSTRNDAFILPPYHKKLSELYIEINAWKG